MGNKRVIKNNHNNNSNNINQSVAHIPEHIEREILAKLPQKLLLELSYTSNDHLKKVISGGDFVAHHFLLSKPALIVQHKANRRPTFKSKVLELDDDEELGFKLRSPIEAPLKFKARSSCNGLILFSEYGDGKLTVMNTAMKCAVTLPVCPSRCLHRHGGVALAFSPSEKVYKVVHVCKEGRGFEVFTLGCPKNEWRVISWPADIDLNGIKWTDPLATEGRLCLHWQVDDNNLLSMDVCAETLTTTPLPFLFGSTAIEIGGKLGVVQMINDARFDVRVRRDGSENEWEIIYRVEPERSTGNSLPNFGNLKPVLSMRDGHVIVFKHLTSDWMYLYDAKLRQLKKAFKLPSYETKMLVHRSSLVFWNDKKQLFGRETI